MPFEIKMSNEFLKQPILLIFQFSVVIATSLLLYFICIYQKSLKNLLNFLNNSIINEINESSFIAYLINWPITLLMIYNYSQSSFDLFGIINYFLF